MARGSVRMLLAAAVASATALGLTGCGQDSDSPDAAGGSNPAPSPADVDACDALSAQTIEALGLPADIAAPVTSPHPGCEWKGFNAADGANADMLLWVMDAGTLTDSEGTVELSGIDVSIWHMSDTGGRYVIPCGDSDLVLNYLPRKGPLGPEEGLLLAAEDVIATYGCAA